MIALNRLNDMDYIKAKQPALIIARRTATPVEQIAINIELNILYNAKYKIKGAKNENDNNKNIITKQTTA